MSQCEICRKGKVPECPPLGNSRNGKYWAAYKETGRHLTGQEVRTWLNTWAPKMKWRFLSSTSNRHRRRGGWIGTMPMLPGRQGPGSRQADWLAWAIERQFLLLETTPDIGRPFPEMPELRELVIAFGDSGYVALYRHKPADDAVYILAFRHQKEAGYLCIG
jgi:plasmid stabilization system protein ParE